MALLSSKTGNMASTRRWPATWHSANPSPLHKNFNQGNSQSLQLTGPPPQNGNPMPQTLHPGSMSLYHNHTSQLRASTSTGHRAHPHLRSEEHTSELQSQSNLVCRLLLEKKN